MAKQRAGRYRQRCVVPGEAAAAWQQFFEGIGFRLDQFKFDPAALLEQLRSSPLSKVDPQDLQQTIQLLKNPPPLFGKQILLDGTTTPRPLAEAAEQPVDPNEGPEQPKPTTARRRPGPRPGEINFDQRARHRLIRRLQRMQRKGERNSQTLDRFLNDKKDYNLPGGGNHSYRRGQVLREWTALTRQKKPNS